MSSAMICRRLDHDISSIFEDFQKLTTDQIPLFTFLAPINIEEGEIELSYEEYISMRDIWGKGIKSEARGKSRS